MGWLRNPRMLCFLGLSALVAWTDDCIRTIVEHRDVVSWGIPTPSIGAETADEAALRFMALWLDKPPTARLYLWPAASPAVPADWSLHAPTLVPGSWESQLTTDRDTAEVLAHANHGDLKLVAVRAKRFGRWVSARFAVAQGWSGNWFVVGEQELLPLLRARNEFWEDAWDLWFDEEQAPEEQRGLPAEDPPLW